MKVSVLHRILYIADCDQALLRQSSVGPPDEPGPEMQRQHYRAWYGPHERADLFVNYHLLDLDAVHSSAAH